MYPLLLLITLGLAPTVAFASNQDAGDALTSAGEIDLPALLEIQADKALRRLRDDPDARASELASAIQAARIEQAAKQAALLDTPEIQRAIAQARLHILTEALRKYDARTQRPPMEAIDALALDLYEAYPEQYALPRRIRIAHISRFTNPEDPQETQTRMSELFERLKGGEDFGELAKAYSQAPNAQDGGGVKEWLIQPRDMSDQPPFTQEAFKLQVLGQVTEPFESGSGWHIVMLEDETSGAPIPYETVKRGIHADLIADYQARRFDEMLKSLRPTEDLTELSDLFKQLVIERMERLSASGNASTAAD